MKDFDFMDWVECLPSWARAPLAVIVLCGSSYLFTHPIPGLPLSSELYGGVCGLLFTLGVVLLFVGNSD